jgi:sulfur relay (sulfurtransferase) complex TusBCD TusD component (DsrE family)
MAPSLGILLADALRLDEALARIETPEETQLFLMDDGVHAAVDARVRALLDEGAEIALCAMDAEARGLRESDGPAFGVRFGSQFDHAVMMREARRVIALTGVGLAADDRTPARDGTRRIAVTITRDARHYKTAQALRSAVGYAAADLHVTVRVGSQARALLAHHDHPPAILRALGTLRGLGHAIVSTDAPADADLEVTW